MVSSGPSRRTALRAIGGALSLPALSSLATASGRGAARDDVAPLGRVEVDGAKEAVVGDDGDTVYLATTDGFATVDVSDPEKPAVLAERRSLLGDREDGPLTQIYDVKVDGDRLVVPGPANPVRSGLQAAVLYDVSDPAAPERLGVYETDFYHHNVYFHDGVLYFGGNGLPGNPLVMVDADALASGDPTPELGRWSPADEDERWLDVPLPVFNLHDLWVQGGIAALAYWDAGTWLVDVSDPKNPEPVVKVRGMDPGKLADLSRQEATVRAFEPPGNDHYVAFDDDGRLLGLGIESWDQNQEDDAGGPGGIELYDVSTPTDPTLVHSIAAPPAENDSYEGTWTTSHNFELAAGRLYSSWYQGGVKLYDVRDPAAPELLGEWADRSDASFWTAQAARPGEFFVASSANFLEWGTTEALYTFSEPALDGTRSGGGNGTAGPPGGNGSSNGTDGDAGGGSGATGAGFGVLGGAAALGIAGWRLARRRRE
ncbi:LVIVD repeat-containing protein [Halomarina pelagica]|uniref:LVIVD repeat-containing protein n=1 Tax=Halomarina pelagica TaxID=2961599 RepID=UPI0020C2D5D0|nr:hypothetical protein [Halomarina sp. BND7]